MKGRRIGIKGGIPSQCFFLAAFHRVPTLKEACDELSCDVRFFHLRSNDLPLVFMISPEHHMQLVMMIRKTTMMMTDNR